jgi:hypothetical protein
MTYCVAKKGSFGVIMAADSALTSDDPPSVRRSSFGEAHGPFDGHDPGRFVQEFKLKIEVIGDCAVTYAGNLEEIEGIIDEFKHRLSVGLQPVEALKAAAAVAATPSRAKIILGYLQDAAPRLATFNADETAVIVDDVDFAAFGNLDEAHKDLTGRLLSSFEIPSNDAIHILVNTLAVLQSYGIHRHLIERGVGGGFCGVALDREGIHWQPDILYLVTNSSLSSGGMVGSFARDNLWCLLSSLGTVGATVFGHERHDLTPETDAARIAQFVVDMESKHDAGRFEYLCVLSTLSHSITVIEMQNNLHHHFIAIDPREDVERSLGIIWSSELRQMIDQIDEPEGYTGEPHDMTVRYIPYVYTPGPPPDFMDGVREKGRIIRPTDDG